MEEIANGPVLARAADVIRALSSRLIPAAEATELGGRVSGVRVGAPAPPTPRLVVLPAPIPGQAREATLAAPSSAAPEIAETEPIGSSVDPGVCA